MDFNDDVENFSNSIQTIKNECEKVSDKFVSFSERKKKYYRKVFKRMSCLLRIYEKCGFDKI